MTFDRPNETNLNSLLKHFEDPLVFSVAPSSIVLLNGKNFDETPNIGVWEKGLLNIMPTDSKYPPDKIFYTSGGCMCVRKNKFLQLGGFDSSFFPFYFEDTDLCWRARKMGLKILYEPSITLLHQSHYTINKFYTPFERDVFYWKNYFLFIWKNINDSELRRQHFELLTGNLTRLAMPHPAIINGCKLAMFSLMSNRSVMSDGNIPDRELLIIRNECVG
jgi:GT2 family glycosyltransferase